MRKPIPQSVLAPKVARSDQTVPPPNPRPTKKADDGRMSTSLRIEPE
jgi:hypothetical protein